MEGALRRLMARNLEDEEPGQGVVILVGPGTEPRRAHAGGYESTCLLYDAGELLGSGPSSSARPDAYPDTWADARPDTPEGSVAITLLVRRSHLKNLLLAVAPLTSSLFRAVMDEAASKALRPWRAVRPDDAESVLQLVRMMLVTYAERRQDWEVELDALVLALKVIIARSVPRKERRPSGPEILALVLNELNTRPESVTLSELAEKYGYSVAYLSDLLRKKTGQTFSELVIERRMRKADLLLRQSDATVRAVASIVGYESVSSFRRQFKRVFGTTPAERMKGAGA